MKRYLYFSLSVGLIVLIGSALARQNGWYHEYWFTDVILHFLSGVGLGALWIWMIQGEKMTAVIRVLSAAAFAVLISFFWEAWELWGWMLRPDFARHYIPELGDSLTDIAWGMLGAIVLILLSRRSL